MPKALTLEERKQRTLERSAANKVAPTTVEKKECHLEPHEKKAVESRRKERIPLGVPRKKLEAKPIEGYHLHWVNDYPGRVIEALAGGYQFVEYSETEINDFVTPGNSDLGTRVKRQVGKNENGDALFAYLMKIEENLWKQDQEELQQRNNKVDEAIRRGDLNPVDNQYGSVKLS